MKQRPLLAIGVIAQELEKEYPELVVGDEITGYKAVAYDKLTAVLIEAVKGLKAENETLRAENLAMREDIARIEAALGMYSKQQQGLWRFKMLSLPTLTCNIFINMP